MSIRQNARIIEGHHIHLTTSYQQQEYLNMQNNWFPQTKLGNKLTWFPPFSHIHETAHTKQKESKQPQMAGNTEKEVQLTAVVQYQ